MVPGVMGLQVKVGSTCVKSKVQVSLVEVVGSSVLVSRSRVRLRVLSPANALLGIAPIITVTVPVEKSGANESETSEILVPLDELRDTWMLKLENGSVLELTAAKAPSLVCLKCCVWAVNTMGKTITATASSFFIFSPL